MSQTSNSVRDSRPGEALPEQGDGWGNVYDGNNAVDETDDAVESAPGDIGEGPDTRESPVQQR